MSPCIVLCALMALFVAQPARRVAKDPELRRELLRRFEVDQKVRLAYLNWLKEHNIAVEQVNMIAPAHLGDKERKELEGLQAAMQEADRENLVWLNDLVERQGWPTITLVGQDGAHSAWLLVQHASADRKFQRRCLDLMTVLSKEEVSPGNVALLTDRVRLAEGKKQIYGTQFTSAGGRWHPLPLEDEASVDARRAEVGLGPLAEYVKAIEELYGPP